MTSVNRFLRIGIDFGGVLSIHDRNNLVKEKENDNNSQVGQHRSTTIDMPDAIETLQSLKSVVIDGIDKIEYHLISFAGKSRARETQESIQQTLHTLGIDPTLFDSLYFTKSKQNKKFVCKYLGIDLMIDDIPEILEDIRQCDMKIKPYLVLFAGDPTFEEGYDPLHTKDLLRGGICAIKSWKEIAERIKTIDWRENHSLPDKSVNINKFIYQL